MFDHFQKLFQPQTPSPLGELGVSKSMECDIFFPSALWHCWLGDRKGIRFAAYYVLFSPSFSVHAYLCIRCLCVLCALSWKQKILIWLPHH